MSMATIEDILSSDPDVTVFLAWQDEKASILRDTYEYIEKLQKQVNDLHYELDTDSCTDVSDESSSDRLSDFTSSSQASLDSQCDHSQPTVGLLNLFYSTSLLILMLFSELCLGVMKIVMTVVLTHCCLSLH